MKIIEEKKKKVEIDSEGRGYGHRNIVPSKIKQPNMSIIKSQNQYPSSDESRVKEDQDFHLRPNLKNFAVDHRMKRKSRIYEIVDTRGNKKSESHVHTSMHRTHTSMTEENDDKNFDDDYNSKERPVTATMEEENNHRRKIVKLTQKEGPINDMNWLEQLKDESEDDAPCFNKQTTHIGDVDQKLQMQELLKQKTLAIGKETTEGDEKKSLGFYRQRTDEKSNKNSVFGASLNAKSFSPIKRLHMQQESQETLKKKLIAMNNLNEVINEE